MRVNLRKVGESALDALGKAFIASAARVKGDPGRLKSKLMAIAESDLNTDKTAFGAFVTGFILRGLPMLSHSEAYRAAYRPAYRVIAASEMDLDTI